MTETSNRGLGEHTGRRAARSFLAALAAAFGVLALSAPAQATVTPTFASGALGLTTDAADPVVVACQTGDTAVNSVALPGPVPCADVQSLTVTGDVGINNINLSAVNATDFPALTTVLVNGGNEPTGPGDVITGSPLSDTINGGAGDETIDAGAGADTVGGDNGNDAIQGGPGDDPDLRGGNANDTLTWNPGDGSDTANGQGGDDFIEVNGADGADDQFTVAGDGDGFDIDRVAPATGHIEVTGPTEDVVINTGDGADTITGGADVSAGGVTADTLLNGGPAVDTIAGTEGRDTITGGTGGDILSGAGGDDAAVWVAGEGDDSFSGGAGTDVAEFAGDSGDETFTFAPDTDGVDIDRTAPSLAHIEADTIEQVAVDAGIGTDTVTGSAGLAALGVNATLAGGVGADTLTGGDGNDDLNGDADTDQITGGGGDDSLVWSAGGGTDTFDGGAGSDDASFNGDLSGETFGIAPDGGDVDFDQTVPGTGHVDAEAIESYSVNGNAGIDTITAATGWAALGVSLSLSGGNDGDSITGSDGADAINGGAGSDTVDAGDGDDALTMNPATGAPTDDYDGDAGDDSLAITGESGNGVWIMQPDSSKVRVERTSGTDVIMLAGTTEHISLDLGSGADDFTASGALGPLGLLSTTILGESGADDLIGSDVPDTLDGGSDNDTVHGGDGNDTLRAGTGSGTTTDAVTGGADDDTLQLNGDGSDETFTIAPDGGGIDADRAVVSPATAAHMNVDTVEAVDVFGDDGEDTITGTTGLAALGIDFALFGGSENDEITGTDAGDEITGDAGADTLSGVAGDDTIEAQDGEADQVDCGDDTDTATIDTGVDTTAACETLFPPVVVEPPPTPPTTEDPICVVLRKQLKKAKSKAKRKKLRKKLKKKGC